MAGDAFPREKRPEFRPDALPADADIVEQPIRFREQFPKRMNASLPVAEVGVPVDNQCSNTVQRKNV